ncbi:MAG: dTMP kinase [Dehalococcoidia bacterium]
MSRGRFVTLEGGEGAGKSTQLERIAARARAAGLEVVTCREPGGTPFGERIREALLGAPEPPSPTAELLAFEAARADLVESVIRPAIERGDLVICDRFTDSTLAYQHFGRGIERATVEAANSVATGGLTPDLTVLLDVAPAEGRTRNGGAGDYLEREQGAFHDRVRAGFLTLATEEPARWLVLDATLGVDEITDAIWARLSALTAD